MTAYPNKLNHPWFKGGLLLAAVLLVFSVWGQVFWEQLGWYRGWSVEGIPPKPMMHAFPWATLSPVETQVHEQVRFDTQYPQSLQIHGLAAPNQWLNQHASPLYPCVDWVLSGDTLYLGPIWQDKAVQTLTEQLQKSTPSFSQHAFYVPTARRQHGTTCHVD